MEEVKMQEYNLYWEMRMKKVIMFGKNGLWEEARRAFNIPQEQGIDIQVKDPKSGERILVRAPKDVPDGPAKLYVIKAAPRSSLPRKPSILTMPNSRSLGTGPLRDPQTKQHSTQSPSQNDHRSKTEPEGKEIISKPNQSRVSLESNESQGSEFEDDFQEVLDERPALVMKKLSTFHGEENGLPIYEVPKRIRMSKKQLTLLEIGKNLVPRVNYGKVLLLMGETGAGKSTLVNAFLNHRLGVKWEDNFRFILVKDEESDFGKSQTKGITAYTIHPTVCSTDFPYALTIIDTPGFGDTEGIGADQDTIQKVKAFFSKDGVEGLDCVHAIGMVIKASANRVTAPQEYVLQTILSLFGNDVGLIFHFLITFADGTTPPVLRIIENKNLPVSKTHHLFNCGALYVNNRDDASGVSKLFWDLATNGIDEFLIFLQDSKPVSLRLTKDVLCERERMDDLVQKLMLQVRKGLEGLEAIRHEYKNTKRNRRKHLKKPLEILARDFAKKQVEVMCLISQAHECQQRLDKIALRPDPLSLVKYVDMLIMVEVNSSDSNSDQRVKALRQVREGAQWMSDIREKGKQFRPFEETLKSLEDEGLKVKIGNQDSDACELEFLDSKRGFLQTLKNFFFGGGGRD